MSLLTEQECSELQQQLMQFQAQQKTAEQVFHQCAGAISFITARIDEIKRKAEELQKQIEEETPVQESTAEAVMD